MSILIKGMKMPKNCTICRFCVPEADPENGEMCMATEKYVPPCNTDRLENCPLVEVPASHGRLIDAEKLERDIEEYHLSDGKFQHWVQVQNSIIEAEEGEEA